MNLYKETETKHSDDDMDDGKWMEDLTSDDEANQRVVDLNDKIQSLIGQSESTERVFVTQLEYLKEEAFKYIDTHRFPKQYGLTGDRETGWNEVQYFLTVPAIWSEKAKDQMIRWAIHSGLVKGTT